MEKENSSILPSINNCEEELVYNKYDLLKYELFEQLLPSLLYSLDEEKHQMFLDELASDTGNMMHELFTKLCKEDISADELIQKLSEGMGVEILTDGGDQAYYSPSQDKIHLPVPEAFHSEYAFNSTALHELSHSTGHPTRLNRPQSAFFGTDQYAYEELVAEMCSCFMGSELKMEASPEHIDNHKAYVQSWIGAIREKPETLIKAIKDAQAAANYMDFKAGLITEKDYEKACGSVMEVKQKSREMER